RVLVPPGRPRSIRGPADAGGRVERATRDGRVHDGGPRGIVDEHADAVRHRVERRRIRERYDHLALEEELVVARRGVEPADDHPHVGHEDAGDVGARLAGVADAVPVAVALVGVRGGEAIVLRIADAVPVEVAGAVRGAGRPGPGAELGHVAAAGRRPALHGRGEHPIERAAPARAVTDFRDVADAGRWT